MHIREARADDLVRLQEIERAAGLCFHDVGMPEIAEDEPLSVEELDRYRSAGTAWVAAGGTDEPVAYLIADVLDGGVHVEQVSVHPDSARRGIGRALLDHVAGWAAARGAPALTLTTFTDVPWNAPYYRRCGFHDLSDDELSPDLRAIRAREAVHGLDRWPRVVMYRSTASTGRRRTASEPAAAHEPDENLRTGARTTAVVTVSVVAAVLAVLLACAAPMGLVMFLVGRG